MMKRFTTALTGLILLAVLATAAQAVVIETVPVGNLGNTGEWSGKSYDGISSNGPDRICGAVDYAYRIGTYEVTAGQYCEFLNAVAATDSYGLYNEMMDVDSGLSVFSKYGCNIKRTGSSGTYTYSVAPDWENRPVNFVSFGNSVRFTNWLHNGQPTDVQDHTTTEDGAYDLSATQSYYGPDGNVNDMAALRVAFRAVSRNADWKWAIPTEDEWYKAAYHKNDGDTGNYFDYPTGSDNEPSKDLLNPDPGNNATFFVYDSGDYYYTIGDPYYCTEVGAHENSESPYGTFDQGGNVSEWHETIIDWDRGKRGGFWNGSSDYLAASYRSCSNTPESEYYSTGFRVVQVPEPSTITLLLFALSSILYLRRRK